MQASSYLEHVNLSVQDPDAVAQLFCLLFDWKIRWSGASMDEGYTVHVGTEDCYLSLYTNKKIESNDRSHHSVLNNLNHIAVVVPDLVEVERKLKEIQIKSFNFGDYDPGTRFYFYAAEGLEVEVVSYR